MHLCRVAPPARGGMEAVVDGLSALQLRAGARVTIVTTQASPGSTAGWVTSAGVPVVGLTRIGPRRWPLAWRLRQALRGVDLVHVHGIDGLADQALTVRDPSTLVGISTHGGYLHTQRQAAIKAVWLRTLTPWSLRRADAIWFTSPADQAALSPAHLHGEVVPNGVSLERARAVRARRAPEPGRLLVLGRVDHHKGLDRLLAALSDVAHRPWTLHVVGRHEDAHLRHDLEVQVARAGLGGRVRWWGELDDAAVDDHLALAQAAIFPSRHEGFGLALVEAQAAGVPCVVEDLPAFADKVEDGVSGRVVRLGEARAGERLLDAVDGMDARTVAAGVAAAERWSWEAVAGQWATAYGRLGVGGVVR